MPGLKLVDFYIRPHLGQTGNPICSEDLIRAAAKSLGAPTYAMDDESGIMVDRRKGDGRW